MIYVLKTILIIGSIVLICKAATNEDFNYLYDGILLGLFGILIKPIM